MYLKRCIQPPFKKALRVSKILRMPLMYCIRCTNLYQSPSLVSPTLVLRNEMAVQVSDLALLLEYKIFATRLWKSTTFSWSIFLQSLFTTRGLLGAALNFVAFYLVYSLLKALAYPQCNWTPLYSLDHKHFNLGSFLGSHEPWLGSLTSSLTHPQWYSLILGESTQIFNHWPFSYGESDFSHLHGSIFSSVTCWSPCWQGTYHRGWYHTLWLSEFWWTCDSKIDWPPLLRIGRSDNVEATYWPLYCPYLHRRCSLNYFSIGYPPRLFLDELLPCTFSSTHV